MTDEQKRAVVETTLREHRERHDFRHEPLGCWCGASSSWETHIAREIVAALRESS